MEVQAVKVRICGDLGDKERMTMTPAGSSCQSEDMWRPWLSSVDEDPEDLSVMNAF